MIDIVKLANGNVAIYDNSTTDFISMLSPDIVEIECNINGTVKVIQDNGNVEYFDPANVANTQVLPAAPIAFTGTCADLALILSTDFFFVVSGGGGTQNLSSVLSIGNASGANDIDFDINQGLIFDNGSRLKEGTTDGGLGGNKGIAQFCSIGYELKWEAGRLYAMEQDGFTIRWVLFQFNVTPTATDDNTKGYVVGSRWTLDSGANYVCTNASTGAAVWTLETVSSLLGYTPVTNARTITINGSAQNLTADRSWNTYAIVPVQSVVSAATVTPTSTNQLVIITAQAAGLTLANPTGAFVEGQPLMIRIKDNGTARSIGYGADYRAIGVTLPTTTVINKTTYLGIIYNAVDAKWDVIGVTTQA